MNEVYEAGLPAQCPLDDPRALVVDALVTEVPARMEREMIELYQNMESLLPESPKRVIQFISSRAGEGVSTVTREYAWMASARLGKSVLILDANNLNCGQRNFFDITNMNGWDDAVREQVPVEAAINRIGQSMMYVSCTSLHHAATPRPCDPVLVKYFLDKVRMRFDITLVDSPSLATGIDMSGVTRWVDGVIMVVEAEKTRWPVVLKAKKKMLNNGGNVLGMVFNKRQNYIPEFIYARL